MALRAARTALDTGSPVLVQVPRRGYVPALACARCRNVARCRHCTGPLSLPDRDTAGAVCRWCGRDEPALRCVRCGSDAVRAVVVGARRTAEELGRAFPGTTVITSGGDAMVAAVPARTGPRRRDARCRTRRSGRLRRGAAAGQLGAARQAGPPRLRGHAAPMDGRHDAGAPPRRRRGGRGGRRVGDPDRAGADSMGSRSAMQTPSSTPAPRSACRPRRTLPPSTARPTRCARCSTPRGCPTPSELLGPVDLPPGARRPPGTPAGEPGEPDAGEGAPRRWTRARGGTAPGRRRAQRAARSGAGSCPNRPVAHRLVSKLALTTNCTEQ